MADEPKKVLPERQRRAMFASIRNRDRAEALELELEDLYGPDFLEEEDEDEDEGDEEERYDEKGNCYLCGELEEDCFCFERVPDEFRNFVPYDD